MKIDPSIRRSAFRCVCTLGSLAPGVGVRTRVEPRRCTSVLIFSIFSAVITNCSDLFSAVLQWQSFVITRKLLDSESASHFEISFLINRIQQHSRNEYGKQARPYASPGNKLLITAESAQRNYRPVQLSRPKHAAVHMKARRTCQEHCSKLINRKQIQLLDRRCFSALRLHCKQLAGEDNVTRTSNQN